MLKKLFQKERLCIICLLKQEAVNQKWQICSMALPPLFILKEMKADQNWSAALAREATIYNAATGKGVILKDYSGQKLDDYPYCHKTGKKTIKNMKELLLKIPVKPRILLGLIVKKPLQN